MDRALWLARHEGIKVVYRVLPDSLLGLYHWRFQKAPLILIQQNLQNGPVYLLRSTLYHELGHFYTLQPAERAITWPEYTTAVFSDIQEARARRWAAQHLVTDKQWQCAARHDCQTIGQLACLWQITLALAETAVSIREWGRMPCACPLCNGDVKEASNEACS